jgi:hypothetical protein
VSGSITQPLNVAMAGFVVYVDTNGNGKLDIIEPKAGTTSDQLLGGNRELLLAYLKDGGSLDYEKLRDKSGILPSKGYNLAWDKGRWLPLNLVELKIKENENLPGAVCAGGGYGSDEPQSTKPSPPPDVPKVPDSDNPGDPNGYNGFPSPTDPNLVCSPDGRSYTVKSPPCAPPPPPPKPPTPGLCTSGYDVSLPFPGCPPQSGGGLAPGQPVPEGWPCPVGGPSSDAGAPPPISVDASAPKPTSDAGAGG